MDFQKVFTWLLGFTIGLLTFSIGLVLCCTIIGIIWGRPLMRLSSLFFKPFGREVVTCFSDKVVLNILFLPLGIILAILGAVWGIFFVYLMDLGQSSAFTVSKFCLAPWGSDIY